ncbi:MAG: DUF1499 domain-containing protein [Pseudomonadota bacterium]|nr:DUF1499 domain-containing protein [Pseudomonadota bacterium]MEC8697412.1 DUF1499 domain-containing protein [Pseudomonadota bacterium]
MNDQVAAAKRWWAQALLIGGVIAVVCLPLGALGTKFGLWAFTGGFMLLAAGAVLATLASFLGVVAYIVCLRKDLISERAPVLIGVLLGVSVLALLGMQYSKASSVPPIHNISTDTVNPPQFEKIVAIRTAEKANPLEYDADVLAPQQAIAYPWVKSLELMAPVDEAVDRAEAVMRGMGLEIVAVNKSTGLVEATATTFWFGFKDDVAVRVTAGASGGSVVDVRSVSRVGQSDLGANAGRIGEILQGLGG